MKKQKYTSTLKPNIENNADSDASVTQPSEDNDTNIELQKDVEEWKRNDDRENK